MRGAPCPAAAGRVSAAALGVYMCLLLRACTILPCGVSSSPTIMLPLLLPSYSVHSIHLPAHTSLHAALCKLACNQGCPVLLASELL